MDVPIRENIQVYLTNSKQAYTAALQETLLQSFVRPLPLLAKPQFPSVALLHWLDVPTSRYEAENEITSQELWDAYSALLVGEKAIPSIHDVQRLTLWYQKKFKTIPHLVILLDEDLFAPALLYAAFYQLPLIYVSNVNTAALSVDILNPQYITIFTDSARLTFLQTQNFYRILARRSLSQNMATGFITGRDFAAVTWATLKVTLLARILAPQESIILWLPWSDILPLETQPHQAPLIDRRIYDSKDSFKKAMIPLLKTSPERIPDLVVIDTHGSEDAIEFSDAVLCGAVAPTLGQKDPIEGSYLTPPCAYGQGCISHMAIPVYNMAVKHILANTCYSLKLGNTTYPNQYNIALSFIDGLAFSYIGAATKNETKDSEAFLFAAAVRAGMTIGQAVHLLNKTREQIPGTTQLILIGNPQAQVVKSLESNYTANLREIKELCWEIEITVTTTSLISIDIPLQNVIEKPHLCCKTIDAIPPLSHPLYFTFVAQEGYCTLYLYTRDEPIPPGHYRFEVNDLAPHIDRLRVSVDNFLAASQMSLLVELLPVQLVDRHVRQVKGTSLSFTQQLVDLFIQGQLTVQNSLAIEQTVETLTEQLRQSDYHLAKTLVHFSGATLKSYKRRIRSRFLPSPALASTQQCLCGNTMTLHTMQHISLKYTMVGYFCPSCGFIYFSPDQHFYMSFKYISPPVCNGEWSAEVSFYNSTDQYIEGYAGILLYLNNNQIQHGKLEDGIAIDYKPQYIFLSLAPHKNVTQRFIISTNGFVGGSYAMCSYFVSNFSISYLQNDIYIPGSV